MNAPRDLSELAAVLGGCGMPPVADDETPADVAARCLRRMRASVEARQSMSARTWRGLSDNLRILLLTMCTDRTADTWTARQPWESFTEAERCAMGATARTWARELARAEWLR